MEKLKFAFFGTPLLASQTLDILKENGFIPAVIITAPDARSGRGMNVNQSPVSAWALKHNIACLKPDKINEDFVNRFKKFGVDISVVVAYGKILPEDLIKIPKFGTINIHYSLLPKYRGASPLESALLNGDSVTGVSIQQMVFKLDSGPILASKEVPIHINDKKDDLRDKLTNIGANLLSDTLPKIIKNKIKSQTQDESKAIYCAKIHKEDGELDLEKGDPVKNYNKYRAFYGWPGVYFFIKPKNGKKAKQNEKIRVKIKEAILQDNKFIIKRVTPEGKKEISYEDFLRQN
ncbi:MAG TPA: methionyl-tRNA formyltransferase [Candidatus Paceibacterota bacterium]|nr:methionyl-tRNA formyltransferase [Candidatus Paceibacterota bacterium]